jgi:ADP-ribosylglycohydrolase
VIGAIFGDIVGAPFEWHPHKSVEFELFGPRARPTDDTVLMLAVAEALMGDGDFANALHAWGNAYPRAGYGSSFIAWLGGDDKLPYGSWGNGSAMRVPPVAWAFDTEDEVLDEAERSAAVTHDHPEGVKGAQAVALAIFLARNGASAGDLQREIEARFHYDVHTPVDVIRPAYRFDVSCQGSVPQALRCALEATNVEEAVRLAISLGGDADTQACIAGAVAEARFGGLPGPLHEQTLQRLDQRQRPVAQLFHDMHVAPRLG